MEANLPKMSCALPYHTDSAHYFSHIRDLPWPVFLDSANTKGENGRYDILAAQPFMTIRTYDGINKIEYHHQQQPEQESDPFDLLADYLKRYQAPKTDLPFSGGAIGYFAYDLGRLLEVIPETAQDVENMPQMAVGIYDWCIVVDHLNQQAWLCSHGFDPQTAEHWDELKRRLLNHDNYYSSEPFAMTSELRANLDKPAYAKAFEKVQNYITEGDCYQVNLAIRFEIDAEGDPWVAYKHLRKHNAAPFSAFFAIPDGVVLSSSPERLLQVNDGQVETKPIKGTRPRDLHNPENDQALASELMMSDKDRAENLMIVDLLRNDIGKVCKPGSIKVPKPFALESFATVHHLVSTITGQLADNETAVSLLKACFPGGSITGAPKLRAMEIIEELEPHRRGIYCGSIGYIGFDGNMDSNITIRTLIYNHKKLRFWAGGGLVTDSDMESEYQEVKDKAAAMFQLIDSLG